MAIKSASHSEKKYHANSKKDKNKQPPTKVVIRLLPPDMTLETFKDQVSPLPEHDYLWFVPADMGLGQHAFSRAYINFLNMEDILTFRDRFDGYVFVDKQGFEFPALVEFAPYQRTPRHRGRKPDSKCGTIADDPDYQAFVQSCEQPEETSPPSWEQTLEEIERRHSELRDSNGKPSVTTPLVTYVCRRRAEKKEERRRREIERRKEEARRAKEKLSKEKRDAKEKIRHETKESAKGLWNDEQERKRDDGFSSKRQDDRHREKYGKDVSRGDKDDKYKRKDKEERWKDNDKSKRDEKGKKEKEERKKEGDWEDKKKKVDRKPRTSDSSSEAHGARAKEGSSRPSETRGGGDGEPGDEAKSTEQAAGKGADAQKPSPAKRDAPEGRRKDPKGDRRIRNKDRPSLAIYRPGMGKYSSRRLQERDSQSSSPTPSGGAADGGEEEPQRRTLVFRRSRAAES